MELWHKGTLGQVCDFEVIDEAGQLSLANVLAISQAATSSGIAWRSATTRSALDLEGYPPARCGRLRFDHLLRGHSTITPDQGPFLAETQRLCPDICAFATELFYDGRLTPHPENQRQRLNTEGPLDGTGFVWLRSLTREHRAAPRKRLSGSRNSWTAS
jgi:hypothetical protein